ncbi:MAG: hypothetical protein EZS28_045713 [Streblomastix strix]|uniref:Uncharacterized protein n=1 Tax=Streblomastix strix TaxID=222440 RepID=A0A5J4TLT3_9EUKA|nr:MAG: hypothetical protein EZS28_045713 [Streblomastix strix]
MREKKILDVFQQDLKKDVKDDIIEQMLEKEISEQSSKWDPFQDGKCERDNESFNDRRFYDSAGLRMSLSSYKGNIINEQGAATNQNFDEHGRLIIDWQEFSKTGVRFYQYIGITQGSRLEDRRRQMQDESKDDIRGLGIALGYSEFDSYNDNQKKEGDGNESEMLDQKNATKKINTCQGDCSIAGRPQLLTIVNRGCISTHTNNQPNEDGSTNNERQECRMKQDYSRGDPEILSNKRRLRDRLGRNVRGDAEANGTNTGVGNMERSSQPEIVKSKGDERCSEEFETFLAVTVREGSALHSDRQHCDGALLEEQKDKMINVTTIEEGEEISCVFVHQDTNGTYL